MFTEVQHNGVRSRSNGRHGVIDVPSWLKDHLKLDRNQLPVLLVCAPGVGVTTASVIPQVCDVESVSPSYPGFSDRARCTRYAKAALCSGDFQVVCVPHYCARDFPEAPRLVRANDLTFEDPRVVCLRVPLTTWLFKSGILVEV